MNQIFGQVKKVNNINIMYYDIYYQKVLKNADIFLSLIFDKRYCIHDVLIMLIFFLISLLRLRSVKKKPSDLCTQWMYHKPFIHSMTNKTSQFTNLLELYKSCLYRVKVKYFLGWIKEKKFQRKGWSALCTLIQANSVTLKNCHCSIKIAIENPNSAWHWTTFT